MQCIRFTSNCHSDLRVRVWARNDTNPVMLRRYVHFATERKFIEIVKFCPEKTGEIWGGLGVELYFLCKFRRTNGKAKR